MIADCPAACALTASASVLQDETCFGDNDGIATASSSNGSGSYTYLWNDPSSQTTATASGLAPAGSLPPTVFFLPSMSYIPSAMIFPKIN